MNRRNRLAFILLLSVSVLNGCRESNPEEPVAGKGKIDLLGVSDKLMAAYADERNAGSLTFAATSDWTLSVERNTAAAVSSPEGASASDKSWLLLYLVNEYDERARIAEDHADEPGTYILTISLEPNRSGEDRAATIVLACGRDRVSFTVTQSGNSRPEPEPGPIKSYNRYIYRILYHIRLDCFEEYIFFYDESGRIKGVEYNNNHGLKPTKNYRFDYVDGRTVKLVMQGDGSYKETEILTLNEDGNVTEVRNKDDTTKNRTYIYEKRYLTKVVDASGHSEILTWGVDGNLLANHPQYVPYIPMYGYSAHYNKPGVNLDLNGLFAREFDILTLLDLTGKRSLHYLSSRPWDGVISDLFAGSEVPGPEYVEYAPLVYQVSKNGYVNDIALRITVKKGNPAKGLKDKNHTVAWYIEYY